MMEVTGKGLKGRKGRWKREGMEGGGKEWMEGEIEWLIRKGKGRKGRNGWKRIKSGWE